MLGVDEGGDMSTTTRLSLCIMLHKKCSIMILDHKTVFKMIHVWSGVISRRDNSKFKINILNKSIFKIKKEEGKKI